MRETVQGVKRVSPRRSKRPASRLSVSGFWGFRVIRNRTPGSEASVPGTASAGRGRTPRPAETPSEGPWVTRVAGVRSCFFRPAAPDGRLGRDLFLSGPACRTSRAAQRRVKVGSHPTRLETRTKESNMCASRRVDNETREAQ